MGEIQLVTEYSKDIANRGSPIRLMFETGLKLAKEHGPENVFDFSLGNPAQEPPKEFLTALANLTSPDCKRPFIHAYTPNRGLPECLAACAKRVSDMHGGVEMPPEAVMVTNGAAGAINVFLKAICTKQPGKQEQCTTTTTTEGGSPCQCQDEIVVFAPYFCEYAFYTESVGAKFVVLPCHDVTFEPDIEALKAAMSPRTRAIIVNSPNNPCGKIYSQQTIDAIGAVALETSEKYKRAVWIISDEPYAKIAYGSPPPAMGNVLACPSPYTVVVTSFSKDLSIPGERIGYLAVSPRVGSGLGVLMGALTFWQRVLGFVNAPAVFQMAVAAAANANVDVSWYDQRRRALVDGLRAAGLEISDPEGAFYAFPRIPEPFGEQEFVDALAKKCVLAVPGSAFGKPGYLRFSYAVKSLETIHRATKLIKEAVDELNAIHSKK